jgi:hypothetical protein
VRGYAGTTFSAWRLPNSMSSSQRRVMAKPMHEAERASRATSTHTQNKRTRLELVAKQNAGRATWEPGLASPFALSSLLAWGGPSTDDNF